MSSSSRPLSSSLVAVPESCAAASPYFSYSSTSSPHSAFSSSPSPSFSSSSSSSSSHSSSSLSSTLPSSNFGSTSAEYYQQNHHHHHHQLPMMAASLDGSNMMKLYNSNGNSKLESFESNNSSWNGGLYGNGTTKVPAYQQQQSQPQQQLDQINFLVRKECCNEIDQAVKELGISAGKSLPPLFFPPLFFACFRIEHSFIHSFTHSFATPVCPAMGIGKILSSFLDAYQSGSTASSFSHKQPTFFLVSILVHRIFLLSLHCEL